MKPCKRCGETKSVLDFYFVTSKVGKNVYRSNTCKPCHTKDVYSHKIKRLWGLSIKDKSPTCQICGIETFTHIDHDHVTNQVRGFLCNDCNLLLGRAKDSVEILEKAIAYLERGVPSNH